MVDKGKLNFSAVAAYVKGYRVNEDGQVISPKGIALKLADNRGKKSFHIRYNGKTCIVYVHRFCAYQKYGEDAFRAGCVYHLDGDFENTRPDNIAIGSRSDMEMNKPKESRIKKAKIASASSVRYTDEQVLEIRKYYADCRSYLLTMRKFSISSKGTLYSLLNTRLVN